VCAYLFLRLYGVPDPILREGIRRANQAGIPVDVESIKLTLRGWRAFNVQYYSSNPDDLEPMIHAREVLFDRHIEAEGTDSEYWKLDVEAIGISLCPSLDFGVEVPESSSVRSIKNARISIAFLPDRIKFARGALNWLGTTIYINGTILKPQSGDAVDSSFWSKSGSGPVLVDRQKFQLLEDRLKLIKLNGETEVDVRFNVDLGHLEKSRIDWGLKASDVEFRAVEFRRLRLEGHYTHPSIRVEQAVLTMDGQSVRIDGSYNFISKEVEGNLKNSITSTTPLELLPATVMNVLENARLEIGSLPQFSLSVGPSVPKGLLNALSGSFSVRDITYCGLEIDFLRGLVSRSNNRLELTNIQASVQGQEERADETGSCMIGGSATGEVFWDANTREFGVSASGSMDPTLIIGPLTIVPVATNAIGRFKFKQLPPQISLKLGSSYVDWSTFYLDIQGSGNEVRIHDATFSSVNASGHYDRGILTLDPIAAMKGSDFMKGTASIDFIESSASFDAFGSMQPEILEDAIYSKFNLFGNKIKTEGDVQIKARGKLEWKTMQKTDFVAEVSAEHLDIPVGRLSGFSGTVTGEGPEISVTNAAFSIYDGTGDADFSIQLNPATNTIPYEIDADVEGITFWKLVQSLNPKMKKQVKGTLSAVISYTADMKQNFFESATGTGTVSVVNGQLADLPFFGGFTWLMRKVLPGFSIFSITSLDATYRLVDGVIISDDLYFGGDLFSARGKGQYSKADGLDVLIQAQIFSENMLTKVVQVITSPIFKLFEIKLEGPLTEPQWKLDNFTLDSPRKNNKSR
ncbi:MAG: AsmA-like C-terminal region-containing protein, partial [Kiritimatiellaceae bacterium]|nr:AsmA-like C-terminal region-containing protein [Kiritimatiellaceae bacterium]